MSNNEMSDKEYADLLVVTGLVSRFEYAARNGMTKEQSEELENTRSPEDAKEMADLYNEWKEMAHEVAGKAKTGPAYVKLTIRRIDRGIEDIARILTEEDLYDLLPDGLKDNKEMANKLSNLGASKIASICAYTPK